ncbi:MAG TPA: hypothetical protein VM597_29555, partial [Gemmataceae bacterium]|nr:hypothetical protein [Gemmataceae bacterium]
MNTDKLARHYPTLSAAERLSLMLSAAARGDEAEHARLLATAPRLALSVSHTHGRAQAYLLVCAHSRMDRLNLAALYFKSSALAAEWGGEAGEEMDGLARVFAHLVTAHARGWALFCERERRPRASGTAARRPRGSGSGGPACPCSCS